ncbi:MAG: NAD(P)-dependent oxidoreductase, partial [Anaerolineae bacterium]
MDYLPLFVDLRGRPVLLVGGGEIAERKLTLLLRAGARPDIVALSASDAVRELAAQHGLDLHLRAFDAADLQGKYLAVAATNDPEANASVFEAGQRLQVLVNSVDQPDASSAIFPAIVDRSPVQIAISTGGSSPTLARVIRGWIEARLPPGLGVVAEFIRARRDAVKATLGSVGERQRFWEQVIDGITAEHVYRGDLDAGDAAFRQALGEASAGMTAGSVALIGAGPGDPELMTLKALRLLQSADVVLYDNLVNRAILEYARRDAEQIYVGKKWRAPSTRQESINALLVEQARAGRNVARLKG